MSVIDTVLVFVGIPAAIVAVVYLLVYGRTLFAAPNRYRPGKAWDHDPSWYLPHPSAVDTTVDPDDSTARTTAVGGASGEW